MHKKIEDLKAKRAAIEAEILKVEAIEKSKAKLQKSVLASLDSIPEIYLADPKEFAAAVLELAKKFLQSEAPVS